MKSFNREIIYRNSCVAAALLLALCVLGNHRANAANNEATHHAIPVIAHLTVPGTPAREMVLQKQNGREYLYLLRSSGKGFTVVDVTKPDKPMVVKKVILPQTSIENLDLLGNSMAIAEQSKPSPSLDHPESIQLLDLRDPANPQPLQTFTGVTSLLSEDGRHLVYISNNDGLWILRRPTKPTTHPCTSSDQISGYPECE